MKSSGPAPIRPVILSGGSGTRLWPLSRSLHPKQLLPVATEVSMLRETVARVSDAAAFAAPIVVGGEEHRFLIRRELAQQGIAAPHILLEPEGRNTAAAIAIAAHQAIALTPGDPLLLVMPSDHVIADVPAFRAAVAKGVAAATAGALVTFGISPSGPATSYGYIEVGDAAEWPGVHRVAAFVEKPDAATATAYVSGGRHLWNGGIFLFGAQRYLDELGRLAPEIAAACANAMARPEVDGPFTRPDAAAFRASPNISVDYAVMEKTGDAAVVPVDMGWSDVGSWDALWEISDKDAAGNAAKGDVVALDSHGNLLRVEGGAPIGVIGVDDLIVVSTRDAVLVTPRARAQEVRNIIDVLKAAGKSTHAAHAVVHRPWGTYETTDRGERFQTKRIVVHPGERLSLQMHHHRSEHWIVVSGTAKVTIDGRDTLLQENESTYIPAGATHRLENPGMIPLHLIEVQCGSYLGEDDIVRLEDSYGRAPAGAAD